MRFSDVELLQQAIRLIGSRDGEEKRAFLIRMLNNETSGGCRSAAASALTDLHEFEPLAERAEIETNKFVRAGIEAGLRYQRLLPLLQDEPAPEKLD